MSSLKVGSPKAYYLMQTAQKHHTADARAALGRCMTWMIFIRQHPALHFALGAVPRLTCCIMDDGDVAVSVKKPVSKLDEQATAKADLSYSYWASGQASTTATLPPKKLTEEEARACQAASQGTSISGASAWNKDLHIGGKVGSVSTTGCKSCAGEAHLWIIRGKPRGGFEFDIELDWTAELPGSDTELKKVNGTLRIPNACPDDLDELKLTVSVEERSEPLKAEEETAVEGAKGLLGPLKEQLHAFALSLRNC
eukprot:jgi/Botrbrau1/4775/Bobra.0137s0047.1